jgi:hypothetical protein
VNARSLSERLSPVLLAVLLLAQPSSAAPACSDDELSFSFRNIKLTEAFAILADFSGNRIEMDQSISWSGPMSFTCRHWRTVAEDLASQHQLKLVIRNRTLFVTK